MSEGVWPCILSKTAEQYSLRFIWKITLFNSWGHASVPRVIAGTRICKSVTRTLVVDRHWVEASPNSYENVLVRASDSESDSEFSLWQIFYTTVRGLTKVFQVSTMVNFGIGLTRRWAFALRLRKITGDIKIPACWKVIWKWENIMSCYSLEPGWARNGCDFDH